MVARQGGRGGDGSDPGGGPGVAGQAWAGRYRKWEAAGDHRGCPRYRAFDPERGVEIGIVLPDPEWDGLRTSLFVSTGTALAELDSPFLERVLEAVAGPGPHLVVELGGGTDLTRWSAGHGPLSLPRFLDLAEHLLEGLASLHHRGLAHGGIDPEGVRVGPGLEVRLGLPDLARDESRSGIRSGGGLGGALRSDLAALGQVLALAMVGVSAERVGTALAELIETMVAAGSDPAAPDTRTMLERWRAIRLRQRRSEPAAAFRETVDLRLGSLGPLKGALEDLAIRASTEELGRPSGAHRLQALRTRVHELCSRLATLHAVTESGSGQCPWLARLEAATGGLARFLTERDTGLLPGLLREIRDIDREIGAELEPGEVRIGKHVLEPLAGEFRGKLRVRLPDDQPPAFGFRDGGAIRALLTKLLRRLLLPLLLEGDGVELSLLPGDGSPYWTLELAGVEDWSRSGRGLGDLEAIGARVTREPGIARIRFPQVVCDS